MGNKWITWTIENKIVKSPKIECVNLTLSFVGTHFPSKPTSTTQNAIKVHTVAKIMIILWINSQNSTPQNFLFGSKYLKYLDNKIPIVTKKYPWNNH